ncbi:MAG: NAD(P)-dependent oxidoreductase [Lysobacterales bacterium]|nr:MAG: NAD(P)-dependent oxidoreductase [Xanthomonadales bacterium]
MTGSHKSRHVCMIGLGKMGSALAEALLANGHKVTVWNRTASKCDPLAEAGASIAESVVEAVQAVEVLVICVLDYDASMSILATDGMDVALKGKTLIQLTTMSAPESVALDAWAREHGAAYLDGAIIGYPSDVREGTAKILFSGSKNVFEANSDVVDALCGRSIFLGEKPGTALVADKLIYAQFYGITFAYLHTAAMAVAAGLSIRDFRELTGGDERWQWRGRQMERFLDMIDSQDYSNAGATLKAHGTAYDHVVRISQDLDIGAEFPKLIATTISQGIENGHSEHELAAIFEVLTGNR